MLFFEKQERVCRKAYGYAIIIIISQIMTYFLLDYRQKYIDVIKLKYIWRVWLWQRKKKQK